MTKIDTGQKNIILSEEIDRLPDNFFYVGNVKMCDSSVKEIPDNTIIIGNVDCEGSMLERIGENVIVAGFLDIRHTKVKKLPTTLVCGSDLRLSYTDVEVLPKDLKIGGSLMMNETKIKALSERIEIQGNVYVEYGDVGLLDSVKVGGRIYTESGFKTTKNKPCPAIEWECQKRKFILADGMFSEVLSQSKMAWRVRFLHNNKECYLVTDGNGCYAHGETKVDANKELCYKSLGRDKEYYRQFNEKSIMSFEEIIRCYRVVTGACTIGVKEFVECCVECRPYTIWECALVTRGMWGNDIFCKFFNIDTTELDYYAKRENLKRNINDNKTIGRL